MTYIKHGARWRRFHEHVRNVVHEQWWNETNRRWIFFCSEAANWRGYQVDDTTRITCARCGHSYTD